MISTYGETGQVGPQGDSNYIIELTNDSGVVVTDANGAGGVYGDNVKTKAFVYYGTVDDSAN